MLRTLNEIFQPKPGEAQVLMREAIHDRMVRTYQVCRAIATLAMSEIYCELLVDDEFSSGVWVDADDAFSYLLVNSSLFADRKDCEHFTRKNMKSVSGILESNGLMTETSEDFSGWHVTASPELTGKARMWLKWNPAEEEE